MTAPDEPPLFALVAWLLARDRHLRPACVRVRAYPPLQCPEEWLGGIALRTWEYGDKTSRHMGECGFGRIIGSRSCKAYYQWNPLVGGEYLLEWLPERRRFEVSAWSIT
jgi:hypothetical protein